MKPNRVYVVLGKTRLRKEKKEKFMAKAKKHLTSINRESLWESNTDVRNTWSKPLIRLVKWIKRFALIIVWIFWMLDVARYQMIFISVEYVSIIG